MEVFWLVLDLLTLAAFAGFAFRLGSKASPIAMLWLMGGILLQMKLAAGLIKDLGLADLWYLAPVVAVLAGVLIVAASTRRPRKRPREDWHGPHERSQQRPYGLGRRRDSDYDRMDSDYD